MPRLLAAGCAAAVSLKACRAVERPVASRAIQKRFWASSGEPPISLTITTGKMKAMDKMKMC